MSREEKTLCSLLFCGPHAMVTYSFLLTACCSPVSYTIHINIKIKIHIFVWKVIQIDGREIPSPNSNKSLYSLINKPVESQYLKSNERRTNSSKPFLLSGTLIGTKGNSFTFNIFALFSFSPCSVNTHWLHIQALVGRR